MAQAHFTAQGIWDQLDDESKALILGRPPDSKRSGTFSRGKPRQKGPSHGTNKINLHDISTHDLLANYHQYQAHQTDISIDDGEVVLTDENVASVERISLGSLRQSLRITVATLSLTLVLFSVSYGVPSSQYLSIYSLRCYEQQSLRDRYTTRY